MNLQLRITKIIDETHDVKSFFLAPVDEIPPDYKAGQFLTLIFQHQKKEIRRSYSIGSVPEIDEQLFITVKRKTNGEISRLLFDHFQVGDILNALPPSGKFVLDEEDLSGNYYFIAAGSGIVPVFALIKELLFHHPNTKVFLIDQNRSEDDMIYKNELYKLKERFAERFDLTEFFSRPKTNYHASRRLHNDLLEAILLQQMENTHKKISAFYLCGPLNFMRMAQFTLRLLGFEDAQIHKEQFVVNAIPFVPLMTDLSSKNVVICYNKKTYRFKVAYPESLLDAGLRNGIPLPFSCRAGQCSTCMAFCRSGKMKMSINEVLTEKDLDKGLVLTCTGFAETDVELDFDVKM